MKKSAYKSPTKRTIAPRTLKKRFAAFLGGKKHASHAATGEDVEDDAPSRPIVRLLVVLLLLHIVVIGGILLRGSILKSGLSAPGEKLSALPLKEQKDAPETAAPVPGVDAGKADKKPAPSVVDNTPIDLPTPLSSGQASGKAPTLAGHMPPPVDPIGSSIPVDEPTFGGNGAQLPASLPASEAKPGDIKAKTPRSAAKHLVLSGDSWESVAKEYACDVNDLKKANPKGGNPLRINVNLIIPSAVGAEIVDETTETESAGNTYTIQKGDTLSRIARKNKIALPKLMKANNFTDADARRIKPGQVIKLP